MLDEIVMQVGERKLDDKSKIPIKGVLIKPDNKHHDTAIMLVTGFNIGWEYYVDYFAKLIGERLPIYIVPLKRRGWATGQTLVDDLVQTDEAVRERSETDNLIYFVHSMGMNIAVEASKQHSRPVRAYFGMAAYSSFGDCFNPYPDITNVNGYQSLVNGIGGITNFGPLAYPLHDFKFSVPAHFVLAERDWHLYRYDGVRERLMTCFKEMGGSAVIIPGNHVFNKYRWKIRPFNQDYPEILVHQARIFVESCMGSVRYSRTTK